MSRLRVLLDVTWASGRGGTARYVRSLHDALRDEPEVEVIAVFAPRFELAPRQLRLPVNGIVHLLWTQVGLPVLAIRQRADVVHTSMTAPVYCPRPVVLTLHDALDFLPDLRPSRVWSAYMRTIGAWAARRADVVLTGTRASAAEIVRFYGIGRNRIRVTPYGSGLVTIDDTIRNCTSLTGAVEQHPYVLMVGAADERKDLATGLRAIDLLRERGVELDAVVVGSVPVEFERAGWVRVCENVSDRDLALLYANALAVLVPSRHEGYGLPVIEALALGTPVVASDLPALREVGGDAAKYAQAGDASAFARELTTIIGGPDEERRRVTDLARIARTLTWEATARSTLAIYREQVEHRR